MIFTWSPWLGPCFVQLAMNVGSIVLLHAAARIMLQSLALTKLNLADARLPSKEELLWAFACAKRARHFILWPPLGSDASDGKSAIRDTATQNLKAPPTASTTSRLLLCFDLPIRLSASIFIAP